MGRTEEVRIPEKTDTQNKREKSCAPSIDLEFCWTLSPHPEDSLQPVQSPPSVNSHHGTGIPENSVGKLRKRRAVGGRGVISICLPIYRNAYQNTHSPPINISKHPSIHHLPIQHPPIHLTIPLDIHPSNYPSSLLSFHPPTHPNTHPYTI